MKGGEIMPRGDRTGPMGMGPMTGRGLGFCTGFTAPGYANRFGCGFGFGRGRGFRRMFNAAGLPRRARFGAPNLDEPCFTSEADEKELLKRQAKFFESRLGKINKRLDELEPHTDG